MKHVIMCFVASLLLSLVSIPMLAQQQSRLISGIVKDESGEPMIGASVLDVSTKQGTIADIDGKFTLEVTSSSKLQISFVGYKDQIISGKDLKKDMLNSSYKCNGIHINNLFKFFVWCEVSKSFTRSII